MITENEIDKIIQPYKDEFGTHLVMRAGNGGEQEFYDYIYIDDLGVNIIINPKDSSFRFEAIIDWLFELKSNNMCPVTNTEHFNKMYHRFRKNLEKFS